MTTIKFSDTELKDLKSFYQLELDKASVRVLDIKSILSKLNTGQTTNGTTAKIAQIRTNRERTYNKKVPWKVFITDTLKQQDKFLQSRQLWNIVLKRFNITNPKEKELAFRNIRGNLESMTKRNEILMKKVKGQKAKLYGLTSLKDKK